MIPRLLGMFKRQPADPDCDEVRELSSDYIDEDLERADAIGVQSHMERCGPCNAFVKTLRATVGLLRNSPKHSAPADFRQRIREGLNKDRSN